MVASGNANRIGGCAAEKEGARTSPKFRLQAQRDKYLWMLALRAPGGIASNHETSGTGRLWDELCHNEKRALGGGPRKDKERLGEAYASPVAMWIGPKGVSI